MNQPQPLNSDGVDMPKGQANSPTGVLVLLGAAFIGLFAKKGRK